MGGLSHLGVHRAPSKRTPEPADEVAFVPPLRYALVASTPERGVAHVLLDSRGPTLHACRAGVCRVGHVVVLDSSAPSPRVVRQLGAEDTLDAMRSGGLAADLYALHLRHSA